MTPSRPILRSIPARLTVFRLLLAIAIAAIVLSFFSSPTSQHSERCLRIADNHARTAADYRRGAGTDPTLLRIAAWHEFMRLEFERAADRPMDPIPTTRSGPPPGWEPPGSPSLRQ